MLKAGFEPMSINDYAHLQKEAATLKELQRFYLVLLSYLEVLVLVFFFSSSPAPEEHKNNSGMILKLCLCVLARSHTWYTSCELTSFLHNCCG